MSVASPRLERLFARATAIWQARPDLHAQHGAKESLGFWNWLMAAAWHLDPELQQLLPTPPYELMRRVWGANATADRFHDSGLSDAQGFYVRLAQAGFDFAAPSALLDFGCGCGRLLRPLARLADTTRFAGADVDADAIQWCREHLDWADYAVLPVTPPSPFPAAHFAGVIAYSVFSHLAEALHRAWLQELARITSRGAVLILTVQGLHVAERFASGRIAEFAVPSAAQMRRDLPTLRERGFLFYPYPEGHNVSLPAADRGAGVHGMTFILPEYIRAHWLDDFELVGVHAAPRDWQDEVVLRRR